MNRAAAFLLTALLLLAPLAAPAQAERQTVGLVFSGGGSKGIAHIGVIKALEDNDIPIDCVAGTSMGAIVGGLYAAGYTPEEMLELILSRGFGYWSTGQIDPELTYYFTRGEATPAMFTLPLERRKNPAAAVPQSIISPLPMNFAFMELFSAYTAACGGDFDRLFVPFRCVASDVDAHRKMVLSGGNLGDAIRASMSFPIVFQPTMIDSTLLYDGGIYDNFPVDVMRDTFAPSIMIGVDVHTPDRGPQTSMYDQLENLVIQNDDYSLPADKGIKIHIDLHEFSLLDFPKAREIYKIGYDHAMAIMDSIKGRVTARTPASDRNHRRADFKASLPKVAFDSVMVSGGTPSQNEYIRYLFRPRAGCDTIGIDRARDAYYRAISSGKFADLGIQATPRAGNSDLFTLSLKAAPKGSFNLAAGGYVTSSTASYIYASARYSTLSFRSLNVALDGWIGQSTMAGQLRARLYLRTPLTSAFDISAVVSRTRFSETEHLFFDDTTPSFVVDHEYFGRAAWSASAGRSGAVSAGIGYGALRASYYPIADVAGADASRDRTALNLGQVFARYESSTLDAENYPTSGHAYNVTAMGVLGSDRLRGTTAASGHPKWVQGEIRTRNFFTFGRHASLGVESDILLSTRKLLATYSASLAVAPAFTPTPSSASAFNPTFRANSFIGLGLVPVYRYNDNLSVRLGAYGFMPMRQIRLSAEAPDHPCYGRYLSKLDTWLEAAAAYRFPFATLSGYVNYTSTPGDKWHVGLALGIFILPPRFLK